MEASYSYQAITNPLVEGWLKDCNQQDFRQGAKGLNSLHPVSPTSTLNSSSNYNEWMELRDTLGCNELEAFKDVLLPETKNFGPDFFGIVKNSVLVPDIFDTELDANGDHYGIDDKFLVDNYEFAAPSEKPKVTTIKLKKVRVPKNKRLRQQDFNVCDYEVVSIPSEHKEASFFGKEIYFTDSSPTFADNSLKDDLYKFDCSSKDEEVHFPVQEIDFDEGVPFLVQEIDFADNSLEDDYLKFDYKFKDEIDNLLSNDVDLKYLIENEEDQRTETPSNVLTLKEAIAMENADSILDTYLSPERSRFSLGSPQEQSVTLSMQEENLISSGTSQCSYSEGVPSPSSSIDDSLFEMNLTEDTEILSSNEFSTSRLKNEKESTHRGRKPRQKMTAESRYLRKKEQNKQAALRYRAKKKLEDEHLTGTLREEENRNAKLKRESKNLTQELKFMKKLLKESLMARNLVSPNVLH